MSHFVSGKLGASPEDADASPVFALGVTSEGADGNSYKYGEAGEAIAAYSACLVDETGKFFNLTTALAGAIPSEVVVPQIDLADGEGGWGVCSGKDFMVLAAGGTAADVAITSTATAGELGAGGAAVQGARLNVAGVAGTPVSASAAGSMKVNS